MTKQKPRRSQRVRNIGAFVKSLRSPSGKFFVLGNGDDRKGHNAQTNAMRNAFARAVEGSE